MVKRLTYLGISTLFLLLWSGSSLAANRQALVIGNGHYSDSANLGNAVMDARAIADKLSSLGFNVKEHYDLKLKDMRKAVQSFSKTLDAGSIVVFYYAGHGIQNHGINYLVPVDAIITRSYEIDYNAINLNMVLAAFKEAEPTLSVAMLDACRNNPYERKINGVSRATSFSGSGLAPVGDIQGSIISYATEPGKVATDGADAHSPYTGALLKHLATTNLSVQDMLNQVGLEVMSKTHGGQKPWFSSSPVPRFCFAGCAVDPYQRQIAPLAEPDRAKRIDPFSVEGSYIERIRIAIISRDLNQLKRLAEIDEAQEDFLQSLFSSYLTLSVKLEQKRSLPKAGEQQALQFRIKEAVNHEGNRVIPSNSWSLISIHPKPTAKQSPN